MTIEVGPNRIRLASAGGGAGGGMGLEKSAGPPSGAVEGDVWWDTDFLMPMYLADNGSVQPIEAPQGATHHDIWFGNTRSAGTAGLIQEGVFGLQQTGTVSSTTGNGVRAINFITGSISGNDAGFDHPVSDGGNEFLFDVIAQPMMSLVIDIGTTANIRFFAGFTNQSLATMVGSDDPAGHYAGVQHSSNRGDIGWHTVSKDGTTQELMTGDGIGISNPTHMLMKINAIDGFVVYELYSGLGRVREKHSTNIPITGNLMGLVCGIETLTASSRSFAMPSKAHWWTNIGHAL